MNAQVDAVLFAPPTSGNEGFSSVYNTRVNSRRIQVSNYTGLHIRNEQTI